MYDLILKNAVVIDGTGGPSFHSDIAIRDGVIVRVARGLEGAEKVLDLKGLCVTPGFIDSHSHSDKSILCYPDAIDKIEQGITTSIGGQCGSAPAPLPKDFDSAKAKEIPGFGKETEIYDTIENFLLAANSIPMGSNTAFLIGHGAVRRAVMGLENREPTPEELEEMKDIVRRGMEAGALGISFGIYYVPGRYAKTEEMIEIAKVVAEYNGIATSHIRSESEDLITSVEEFLRILRESGVRGVFSHHKSAGKENWGKCTHSLRMIEEANENGMDVYLDVYPYIASHTSLSSRLVPDPGKEMQKRLADPAEREKMKEYGRAKWGEDLSWILLAASDIYPEYVGKTLDEIAALRGTDSYDAAYDLLLGANVCNACYFTMCEEDVERILSHPRAMICTDSGLSGTNIYFHPRLKATFPRVLSRYVRERKVTSLPEMIRKMTSMPASVYGLGKKGLIREGMDADLCIFDPEKIRDLARFDSPDQRCEGLKYVLVAGEIVVEDAVFNGKRKGKAIIR
jgi:N-acyl-D-amino-acid deacylase